MPTYAEPRRARAWLVGSLCAVAVVGAALLPSPAAAAEALVPEGHVFPTPAIDATSVDAAFAPNGFGAVAWIERETVNEAFVDVSLRPPGGEWSAPDRLTLRVNPTDPPTGRTLSGVQVAVNADGAAAVTWEERASPSTFTVAVASRPANGAFRRPELVNPALTPLVGVDGTGEVTFVHGVDAATGDAELVRTAPAGAAIAAAAPQPLSSTCGAFDADLDVAPSGDAIVGFKCGSGVNFGVRRNGAWTMSRPFTESFVSCPNTGNSTLFGGVRVAIDGDGHPAGAVQRSVTSSDCQMFPTTFRSNAILLAVPAGGAMAAGPQVAASGTGIGITPVPNDASFPDVGIGGGSLVVAWRAGNANGSAYQPATRTYGGNGAAAPGAVEPIGVGGPATPPPVVVGVGSSGQALVTAFQGPAAQKNAVAAFRPPGGSFGPPLPVGSGAADVSALSAETSDAGDSVVAWLEVQGTGRVAHARGFDATPPQLSGVSVPATAEQGVPAPFAAQAFDVWGPVSFAWNFGDGTATDANPSHAFSGLGPQPVTVTATDSIGNSASQGGSVDVRAAGTGGPGGPVGVGGPGDTPAVPPGLTRVSQTNRTFRVGRSSTATSAGRRRRAAVGTAFRFVLDKPASVAIEIARAQAGRRSGRRCVRPTKRLARRKRCTRFVRQHKLARNGELGANRVAYSGRVRRRALKPGSYRATFVATSAGVTGASKALRFKVVR